MRHDQTVAVTRAQQREVAGLVERLLQLVSEGSVSADGPVGAALVRRLEGVLIGLRALTGHVPDQTQSSSSSIARPG